MASDKVDIAGASFLRPTAGRPWRVLRWLRRAVVLPATLAIIAYVTLPWWLPTEWLHGQIVSQLQRDLNRPVSLKAIEVSWDQGVVLRELRIRQADPFGPGDVVFIQEVSCPLTPLRTLFSHRIGRLRITGLRLNVVRNEAGELNLDGKDLPRPTLKSDEIVCDDATVMLVNRKSRHTAEVRLGTVDCRIDPGTGEFQAALSGRGGYSGEPGNPRDLGNFSLSGNLLDPFAAPAADGGPRQGGQLQLTWRTVDLANLTVNDWQAAQEFGLLKLAGQCGGTLDLQLNSKAMCDWRFKTGFEKIDLELARRPRNVRISAGRVELAGHYDIPNGHNEIDQLAIELPGLALQANVEFRPERGNYFRLQIKQARVRPELLRQVAPDLLDWMDPRWRLAGELTAAGKLELSDRSSQFDGAIDATALEARAPGWLDKPAGLPATAQVHVRYDQDVDRLEVDKLVARLGGSEVNLKAAADQLFPVLSGRKKIWDVWLNWTGELALAAADSEELLARLPALRQAIGRTKVSGPADVSVKFQPIFGRGVIDRPVLGRLLTASARLGQGSRLTVFGAGGGPSPDAGRSTGAVLIDKRGDEPVELALSCRFSPDDPTVERGSLIVRRGREQDDDAAVLAVNPFSSKLAFSYPAGASRESRQEPLMNLVLDGELIGLRVERLIELSPRLRQLLADERVELAGGFQGDLGVRLGPEQMRARLAVQLNDLGVRAASPVLLAAVRGELNGSAVPAALVKPPGEATSVAVDYASYPAPAGGQYHHGQIDLAGMGVQIRAEASRQEPADPADDPAEERSVEVRIEDATRLLDHSPLLADLVRRAKWSLAGSLAASASWQPGGDHLFAVTVDATGLEARPLDGAWPIGRKPAGMPMKLAAQVSTNLPNGPVKPKVTLQQGRLTVGKSDLEASGSLVLLPVWWGPADRQGGGRRLLDMTRPPPIDRADLTLTGRLEIDDQVQQLLPALAERIQAWGAAGRVDVSAQLTGGWRQLELKAEFNGDELAIDAPAQVVKPATVPARVRVDLAISPGFEVWDVRRCSGQLADVSFSGSGQLCRKLGGLAPANYDLTVAVKAPDLDRLAELCPVILSQPQLLAGPLAGRLDAELHLFADDQRDANLADFAPPSRPRLMPSRVDLAGVRAVVAGTPLAADGRVEFSQRSLFVPQLAVQLGDSKLAVTARVSDPMNKPAGWVDVAGERLDIDQVKSFVARLQALPDPSANPALVAMKLADPQAGALVRRAGELSADAARRAFESVSQPVGPPRLNPAQPAASRPAATQPAGAGAAALTAQAARQVVDFVAGCDLAGDVHIHNVAVTDAKNQTRYTLGEFTSRFVVDAGQVIAPFQTAMEGGLLTGQLGAVLTGESPTLSVTYDANRLYPTRNVQPMIYAFFPGMNIYGHVTMIECSQQKLLPRPGEANWPVGTGEVIFDQGMLKGQAGPDWMVKIFPGLKLTEYRFARMHDWFNLTADGRANHHMIFDGQNYNIFMVGYTHRGTGQAEYTVGVDLLASLDSHTWSVDLRQGKIALMYVSGRIENRELKDAKFEMVSPPVALGKFLFKDSLLYTAVIRKAIQSLSQEPLKPPAAPAPMP